MTKTEQIREAVRYVIKRSHMTQTEIAEQLGYSQSNFSKRIQRSSVADINFLTTLAQILEVDPNLFLNPDWVRQDNIDAKFIMKNKRSTITGGTFGHNFGNQESNTGLVDMGEYIQMKERLRTLEDDNRELYKENSSLLKQVNEFIKTINELEREIWELKKKE